MKVPKHYFHDRTILTLVGASFALFLLSLLAVFLGVDADENPTGVVAYRDTLKVGRVTGDVTELYQFAIFAIIVTVASVLLSMKMFAHRRNLAVGILALNCLLLIMSIIVFFALTQTP